MNNPSHPPFRPVPGPPPGPPPMMDTSNYKRKWLDVPYASQSPTQCLDIYLPDEGEGPFPVIAAIHGGAWMMCDKRDIQQLPMLEGLKRNYAVVSINYRLSPEAIFPAQIYDCKAAICFIRANATKYGFNPDRIVAWGGSAGGHLCALLGTSLGVKELEDLTMGNPDASSRVQAVVDWFGPAESFLKMDEELIQSGNGIANHSSPESPESKLLGRTITEAPELVAFASPMTYITADVPPFLIQHGSLDEVVPVEQSIHFAQAIEKLAGKDKVTLELLQGCYHADPAFETPQNVKRVLDFIDLHLKK
jgi:acetyl esterase/lipase